MLEKYALIKIIKYVLEKQKGLYGRGIAKALKISPSTAKCTLDFLLKNNILNREVIGRTYNYSLNNNFLVRQIKILNNLIEIWQSGLVNEIVKKCNTVVSIVVYGSVARGEDDVKSDLDLLIITRKPCKIASLGSLEKIKKEITITTFTVHEWRKKAVNDKAFYDNVSLNCINLYGEKPVVI